jgi:glycosyltransferase involved in cell wall biosynthesis
MHDLTIVIPSYNHSSYVLECIESAIAVSIESKRILVIDDGSTDDTINVVSNYLESIQSDIVELIVKENKGLVDSLNLGLEKANSKYIYFIASDDIIIPSGIMELFNRMQNNESIDFIIGGGYSINEKNEKREIYRKCHFAFFELDNVSIREEIYTGHPTPILIQTTLYRTKILREVGGFDRDLKFDDYPLFIKLITNNSENGKTTHFLNDIKVAYYRQHDNNASRSIERQFLMSKDVYLKLAPKDLLNLSMSNCLAFYFLFALKNKKLKSAFFLLKHLKKNYVIFFIAEIYRILINRKNL